MNIDKLKNIIPDSTLNQIKDIYEKSKLNTPLRLAHFLSQVSHESSGFKIYKENLNYSADGLHKIFSKYFPTLESALPYAKHPEKIGNKVYSNRMGNGNELSGDGYKYSGKGFIQLTGKDNYESFSKYIGEDCVANPDLIATKYPLASAVWFWDKRNISIIADKGSSEDVIKSVTKAINGGLIGLLQRINEFNKFHNILK